MIVERNLFTPLLKLKNFKPYFTDYKNQIVRFVDLFAGLGGLRLGFEQASSNIGLKSQCILSSEIKKVPYKLIQIILKKRHKVILRKLIQTIFLILMYY